MGGNRMERGADSGEIIIDGAVVLASISVEV
jgi:hypothetical protein